MEEARLFQLGLDDHSWDALLANWRSQCDEFDEDFEGYGEGTLSVIRSLVGNPEKRAAAFAIRDGDEFQSIMHVNTARIKGYNLPVMRVRHIMLSPRFDFGEFDSLAYSRALSELFTAVYAISIKHDQLAAKYIKFHFRSPADQQFFVTLAGFLNLGDAFEEVTFRGSWLYLTRKEAD